MKKLNTMNTSERLKYIRQKTGLSQAGFAFALGEKASRINSIESGKQLKFPCDLAEKILNIFPEPDISFKWMITGEEDRTYSKLLFNKIPEFPEMLSDFIYKISETVTDKELNLIFDCLGDKKELTVLLLKKLQKSEHQVKKFLLKN
jgi:transcriptional regulator with XRE-family HTH domain